MLSIAFAVAAVLSPAQAQALAFQMDLLVRRLWLKAPRARRLELYSLSRRHPIGDDVSREVLGGTLDSLAFGIRISLGHKGFILFAEAKIVPNLEVTFGPLLKDGIVHDRKRIVG